MKFIYVIILLNLCFNQTTFNFLNLPYNSRSLGLNNVGVASSSEYLSINPASIQINKNQYSFNYSLLPANIKMSGISITKPFETNIIFTQIRTINYGDLRDDSNNLRFSANDFSFEFGHKFELKKVVSIGYSLGYISSRIFNYSASGLYSNIGFKFNFFNDRLAFGSMINNLGFQIHSYTDKNELLPTSIRNGLYYKPLYLPVNLYLDYINLKNDIKNKICFGLELFFDDKSNIYFSLVSDKNDLDIGQYYKDIFNKVGFGFNVKIKQINYNFSIQNLGPLGIVYGFSIIM